MIKKKFIIIEFIILFVLLPLMAFYFRQSIKYFVIPFIAASFIATFFYLRRNKSFNRKLLYSIENLKLVIHSILLRFSLGAIVITLFTYFIFPENFVFFPRHNFSLWLIIMIVYPLISVYAQEVIFRAFFFFRYRNIFSNPTMMIIISGVAFGMWHLLFGNWIAPVLSTAGGILFAKTYSKTNSVLIVSLEHALWGDFLFTIGLGYYFYSGAI